MVTLVLCCQYLQEMRKLRKQRREEREKEKQDLIRQGLLEPPPPKVCVFYWHSERAGLQQACHSGCCAKRLQAELCAGWLPGHALRSGR